MKIKEWFKEHGNKILGTVLFAGTGVACFMLGVRITEICTGAGIYKNVADGKIKLFLPNEAGEMIPATIDEWLKNVNK